MSGKYEQNGNFVLCLVYSLLFTVLTSGQSTAATHGNSREGWLFFKRTGQGNAMLDEWEDSAYSDTSDLDRYTWDLDEMMSLSGTFRSPLLEHWGDMNMLEVVLYVFNADGEEMDRFNFIFDQVETSPDNFTYYLSNLPGAEVIGDRDYGVQLSICESNTPANFKLNVLDIYETGSSVERFIVGTSYSGQDFVSLPKADHLGCYKMFDVQGAIHVDEMHQCSYHCLSTTVDIYALHTETYGNYVKAYCQCLYALPTTTSALCDRLCFSDDQACGQLIDSSNPPNGFGASIYNISTTRTFLQNVSDMSNTTDWKMYDFTPSVDTTYSASFGAVRYIRRIILLSNTVYTYTLATTIEDCTASGFNTDAYHYHGSRVSNITIFSTDAEIVLDPVPAMCVFINFTTSVPDTGYIVNFKFITSDFVFGEYFGVRASWNNRECVWSEVMQYEDVIPNSAVQVTYGYGTDLVLDQGSFTIYQSSVGVVDIRFPYLAPVSVEYWIKSISVTSPLSIIVDARVLTSRYCTDHLTSQQYMTSIDSNFTVTGDVVSPAELIFSSIRNPNEMFCGQDINLSIRIPINEITNVNGEYVVNVAVMGCVLATGANEQVASTCVPQDFTKLTSLHDCMTTRLVPLPKRATPALRPGEPGLLLVTLYHPTLTVVLSDEHDTELQSATLKSNNNGYEATFKFEGDTKTVKSDANGNLLYQPSINMGRKLVITDFISYTATYKIKLQIVICTNKYGYFYNASTANTTNITPASPTVGNGSPTISATTPTLTVTVIPTQVSMATTIYSSTTEYVTNSASTIAPTTSLALNAAPVNITASTTATKTSQDQNAATTPSTNSTTTSGCCPCGSFKNLTAIELDNLVKSLVANLTVKRKSTSAYRRKLISASDSRPSATVVGCTCGVVVISLTCVFLVIMDLGQIKNVIGVITSMIQSG